MHRGLLVLLAVLIGAWALIGVDASGQSNPFQRLVGREEAREPAAQWFERADGRGRFVFDRSSRPALIWPEGSAEVLVVSSARASGGGEIWVTPANRVVLRFSNLGGATYFPESVPGGVIADSLGEAAPLFAEPASARDLQRAATRMVETRADEARREVTAELTDVNAQANGYIADTVTMVELAAREVRRSDLRDLEIVRIGVGEAPRVTFRRGVLDISVDPSMGYAGRPSSAQIALALERG